MPVPDQGNRVTQPRAADMVNVKSSWVCYWSFVVALLVCAPIHSHAGEDEPDIVREAADYPGNYRLVWNYSSESAALQRPVSVQVQDKNFIIDPGIKPPTINSVFLLEHSEVNEGEEVLDVGTGSGLHAVFAADKAKRVVATDIYAPAVENAKRNAEANGVVDKIDFRVGDLFAPLKDDEKFDVIFLNVAYPFGPETRGRWQLHERFFSQVHKYMKPNARIYYQVGFLRNIPYIVDMLARDRMVITRMYMVNAPTYQREPIMMLVQQRG
jgi:release factor glutamine methyltransferase